MNRKHPWILRATAALGVVGATATAHAQPTANARRFQPSPVLSPYLTLDGAHTQGDGGVAFSVLGSVERRPLIFYAKDGTTRDLVYERWTTDVVLALGLLPRVDFGLHLPIVVNQTGRTLDLQDRLDAQALGDPALAFKLELLDKGKLPVGVALVGHASLPLGASEAFVGERESTWGGRLVVEVPSGTRFDAVLNAGYRARPETTLEELVLDDEYFAGVGLSWRLWPRFALNGELQVGTSADEPFQFRETTPADANAGVRIRVWDALHLTLGGGAGLNGGYGSPTWRALGGLEWLPQRHDWDGDRVADGVDRCLEEPGIEREAGCPAQAVAQPLPSPSPVRNSADADNDTIADALDRCPYLSEDLDRFQDDDGCPDPDDDLDLVADAYDGDPRHPEDWDGRNDDDGIPDLDDDRDGVADLEDACPLEAGDGDDGCPGGPKAAGTEVALTGGRTSVNLEPGGPVVLGDTIHPPEPVLFEFASTRFTPDTERIIDGLAAFVKTHPELGNVEVGVHVDAIGERRWKLWLSQSRADAVKAALVSRGVPESRLSARGYGPDVPVADNDEALGRWLNRRVELRMVERSVANETAARGPIQPVRSPEGERGAVLRPTTPLKFGNKSAALSPESAPQVAELAARILENPQWPAVEIAVYTDGRGDLRVKEKLSEARARTVKDALAARGVPARKLVTRGFGGYVPIADDGTAEGRARNRRVELTVLERPRPAPQARVKRPAAPRPQAPSHAKHAPHDLDDPSEDHATPPSANDTQPASHAAGHGGH